MSSATKKPTIRCMLDVSLEGVFFNPDPKELSSPLVPDVALNYCYDPNTPTRRLTEN
jgi:hypothetical protein